VSNKLALLSEKNGITEVKRFVETDEAKATQDGNAPRSLGRTGRLQLVLTEQAAQRLERLREGTDAASYAEVIRRALMIYEGLFDEARDGSSVFVRRADGSEEPIPIKRIL